MNAYTASIFANLFKSYKIKKTKSGKSYKSV